MKFLRQLHSLFRREKSDAEMTEEMRHHVELQMELNRNAGMNPEEARYAALRQFGNVASIQEQARAGRGWVWLEQLWQDLRHAFRHLWRTPGFTCVAVLSLAIGVGANTAIFTAVNAVMLRPLPVADAGRLVYIANGRSEQFSFPFYVRLRQSTRSFAGLAAGQAGAPRRELMATGSGEAEMVPSQAVTGNFFTVLGVPPQLGRMFGPDDDRIGSAQPVAVISHAFWQRRFAADPAVIGRSVRLNDVPLTIVGVMPPGFAGFEAGANPDLWWPIQLATQIDARERGRLSEGVTWLILFGRLQDQLTPEQAQAEVGAIFRAQLEEEVAKDPKMTEFFRQRILSQSLQLHPGAAGYVAARSQFKQPLVVLMAAVGVVLLIACTNVAGLLLARGANRQREFAVRAALGAGRGRIIRQLVSESVLLAAMGGATGLLFAQWGTAFLTRFLAQSDAPTAIEPDGRVLLFTIAVSLLTGLIFGLAPALRLSRLDLVTAIKHPGSGGKGRSRPWLQPALVGAQVALAVMLLTAAGLFGRTLYNLRSVELGFQPGNLVLFSLDPGRWRPAAAEIGALQRRLLTALETAPGARSVSVGGAGMLSGNGYNLGFSVAGYAPAPGEELRASVLLAGPRFFETLRIPLLRGREFSLADEPAPAPPGAPRATASVVILGEAMANKFFGETDPVGRHIMANGKRLEVVGVARDTKYRSLREKIPMQFYLPYFGSGVNMPSTFYLRTGAGMGEADIRGIVTQVEPRLAIRSVRTMDDVLDRQLVRERIIAQLVGFFSAFALLLASLGVYGLLSYGVTQRTREIGVRMALGAVVRDVTLMIVRQGLALALAGCVCGIVAALLLTRFVATLLYEVKPADPLTLAGVAALLLTVVIAACWLPARRAAKVDPGVALRAE